jgi:hypothetical protein
MRHHWTLFDHITPPERICMTCERVHFAPLARRHRLAFRLFRLMSWRWHWTRRVLLRLPLPGLYHELRLEALYPDDCLVQFLEVKP